MTVNPPQAESAPPEVRWCCRCASRMVTREIGGKPRRACPSCRYVHFVEPKVGVGVAVVEGGRLLLVKRGFAPAKGKWSVPAGFLDRGDDPREHAVREVREETGLDVRIDALLDVFHNPPAAGGASVFILFSGSWVDGKVRAGDDALEAAFFAPGSLPELAFESTLRAVALLRDSIPS